MLADPDVTRLRDAIARALRAVPRLDAEAIEQLAAINPLPVERSTHAALDNQGSDNGR
jgi:hypothetical protein